MEQILELEERNLTVKAQIEYFLNQLGRVAQSCADLMEEQCCGGSLVGEHGSPIESVLSQQRAAIALVTAQASESLVLVSRGFLDHQLRHQ
jgi:hypothetical protein